MANEEKATGEMAVRVRLSGDKESKALGDIQSNVREVEDEFAGFYQSGDGGYQIIEPPYTLTALQRLEQQNNAISQCVDAMEVNIDGTGFVIEAKDDEAEDAEDDAMILALNEFFDEPWPGESFITIRRKLRRDLELTGNAYMECLRNAKGELVLMRHVASTTVRIVRLDSAVSVKKTLRRRGQELPVSITLRERRFVQTVSSKLVYFKEFGASRDLNKNTGVWAPKGEQLNHQLRATELLHFTVKKDVGTPYGVPRWINQIPSVLGSRKAEEHNLSFFERGGIPPVVVFIQGGKVAETSAETLDQVLNGAGNKHSAAVVELYSTGGTLEKDSAVKATVERFGSERQSDSMFETYDSNCERRVRSSFRLPPIFVGKADDYSFATAYASYTVAEAQVFTPERTEFDEMINIKVMPELGGVGYVFRSLPLAVRDVTQQLKGVELAQSASAIDKKGLVDAVNEITNMNMRVAEETEEDVAVKDAVKGLLAAAQAQPAEAPPTTLTEPPAQPMPTPTPAPAMEKLDKHEVEGLVALADEVMSEMVKDEDARDPMVLVRLAESVQGLTEREGKTFRTLMALKSFSDPTIDPEGTAELAGCALAVMAQNQPPLVH